MRKIFLIIIPVLLLATSLKAEAKGTYVKPEIVETVQKYAEEYSISEFLILSIIEHESSGRQYAENGSCKGLMQVNVSVHQDLMETFGVEDIYDIDGNIHIGVEILYRLIVDKCYGDIPYALSRYNGIKNAKKLYLEGKQSGYATRILERAYELQEDSESKDLRREKLYEILGSGRVEFPGRDYKSVKRFIETIKK